MKSEITEDELARRLAAIAHPARLRILRALACREKSCCKDVVEALPLAQSTISQHLKVLSEAGLVTVERQRPHSHYRINRAALDALGGDVTRFAGSCCPDLQPDAAPATKDDSLV